ncbi:MAG: hypothetical protein HY094_05055 [Candidatus Melainabacteria bacterium]|nr:hypothetical protein [Candidatus Melainabacteria bacterium]
MKRTYSLILFFFVLLCILFLTPNSQAVTKVSIKQSKQNTDKKIDEENSKEKKKKEPKEPINESEYNPVLLGALLESPGSYLDKKIKIRGRFSSFTTLALDYKPAMRKSKDYISLCLFRADGKIPLSELKLAYPVKEAKEDPVIRELEEGDLVEMYGKVFSTALDEPWVDIISIKKIESANKNSSNKIAEEKDKKSNDSTKKIKKNDIKQQAE